jgi:hypothetical protein
MYFTTVHIFRMHDSRNHCQNRSQNSIRAATITSLTLGVLRNAHQSCRLPYANIHNTIFTLMESPNKHECVSCKEGKGGKHVFSSKSCNLDYTVFLYANLFFLKKNGSSIFPQKFLFIFHRSRPFRPKKPKNSKCLEAIH